MRMVRQLAALRAEDAALVEDVRRALVDSLYAPFASLVVGAFSGAIIATTAALWSADLDLTLLAIAIGLVGAARIGCARWYLSRVDRFQGDYRAWERAYALGAFAFASLIGVLAFVTVVRSDNIALQVVTSTTAIGYAAGIAGRNAGRPVLAIVQLLLASLPLVVGLLLTGEAAHVSLGAVIVLFSYGMIDITLSTRTIVVTALVTTHEKAALADRLAAQANLFEIALSNMSHGLCMFGADGRLQVWNTRFAEIVAPTDPLLIGADARDVFASCARSAGSTDLLGLFVRAANQPAEGNFTLDLPEERALAFVHRRTEDGGLVVIVEDITERRRNEARVHRMARYDSLTGLHNRNSFAVHVAEALRGLHGRRHRFAILLLDLDRFKAVNDTMGHPTGDLLLQHVAERLRAVTPQRGHVARLGGDEFVVVQDEFTSEQGISDLAAAIVRTIEEPFDLDGSRVAISASIGIALAPDHSADGDRLLKCADIALYAAKAAGRGTFQFFQPEMEAAAHERHAVEADLRMALERGEFELHYQPIIDLRTGSIACCEALLRWHHPERGLVAPADFIPMAEETGLILPIGQWVLNEACQQARTWPASIGVAVNLSAAQFSDPRLPMQVVDALDRSGLGPHRLELEATETVTLGGNEATLTTMANLRTLGVRLSLDDFGTGYSSLSYLTKYRFDTLKIDRTFVADLQPGAEALAIVRAIVAMAKNLDMTIVVEGVETHEQLDALRAEGCDLGQGYLFSRPLTAEAVGALLARREPVPSAFRRRAVG